MKTFGNVTGVFKDLGDPEITNYIFFKGKPYWVSCPRRAFARFWGENLVEAKEWLPLEFYFGETLTFERPDEKKKKGKGHE